MLDTPDEVRMKITCLTLPMKLAKHAEHCWGRKDEQDMLDTEVEVRTNKKMRDTTDEVRTNKTCGTLME